MYVYVLYVYMYHDCLHRLEHAMSHSMSDHCKASLRVNETLAMSGEQAADTSVEKAKKVAVLYLGGLPSNQNITAELPVTVGITGCITRLQVSNREIL